ncbi:hypothetical protein H5410_017846 [Solanum commersonii]|uniref:Uncharacterized protein n=1 Tax=Solanum commersonii TaxID=4109 RepID=A0A9J6A083_SOLCO|nr:hypothetical protein H5410_017846 [Solanum commersonii]
MMSLTMSLIGASVCCACDVETFTCLVPLGYYLNGVWIAERKKYFLKLAFHPKYILENNCVKNKTNYKLFDIPTEKMRRKHCENRGCIYKHYRLNFPTSSGRKTYIYTLGVNPHFSTLSSPPLTFSLLFPCRFTSFDSQRKPSSRATVHGGTTAQLSPNQQDYE